MRTIDPPTSHLTTARTAASSVLVFRPEVERIGAALRRLRAASVTNTGRASSAFAAACREAEAAILNAEAIFTRQSPEALGGPLPPVSSVWANLDLASLPVLEEWPDNRDIQCPFDARAGGGR